MPTSIGSFIHYAPKPTRTKAANPFLGLPLKGGILEDPNALTPVGVDPVTGQPDPSQKGAEPEYDPVTGEPIFKNPKDIPVLGQDPTTGEYGSWEYPDWNKLLAAEAAPGLTRINAARNTAGTTRAAAIRNALYNWGIVPSNQQFQDPYGDIRPEDIAAAGTNNFSVLHLLEGARARDQATREANVIGRGLYTSGALTGADRMAQQTFEGNLAPQTTAFLQALGLPISNYAGAAVDFLGQENQVYADAGQSLIARGLNQPTWKPYRKVFGG